MSAPPVRTAIVENDDHLRLASCVGEALMGSSHHQVLTRPDLTRTSVTGFLGYSNHPVLDLRFIQHGAAVVIEARVAGPMQLDREAWPVVTRCAGARTMRSAYWPRDLVAGQ